VKANSASDFLKRWGLLILLGIAVAVGALCWLFPVSRKGKPQILKEAQDAAAALKDRAATELKEHEHRMAARRKELEMIGTIKDEDDRLKALASFANRREGR